MFCLQKRACSFIKKTHPGTKRDDNIKVTDTGNCMTGKTYEIIFNQHLLLSLTSYNCFNFVKLSYFNKKINRNKVEP